MKQGAFALLDCLGFREISKRHDAPVLIERLRNISDTVKGVIHSDELKEFLDSGEYLDPTIINYKTRFFADTIIIGLQYEKPDEGIDEHVRSNGLVKSLSKIAIKIADLFVEQEPRLVLRGCITFGEFEIDGDFFAGPAVNIAGDHHELANGAFIWLHQSAAQYIQTEVDEFEERMADYGGADANELKSIFMPEFIKYEVPLKNIGSLECIVLNTLRNFPTAKQRKGVLEIYRKTMESERLDVILKQQNTLKFLRLAYNVTERYSRASEKLETLINRTIS